VAELHFEVVGKHRFSRIICVPNRESARSYHTE
jgi:hypothetical protein